MFTYMCTQSYTIMYKHVHLHVIMQITQALRKFDSIALGLHWQYTWHCRAARRRSSWCFSSSSRYSFRTAISRGRFVPKHRALSYMHTGSTCTCIHVMYSQTRDVTVTISCRDAIFSSFFMFMNFWVYANVAINGVACYIHLNDD